MPSAQLSIIGCVIALGHLSLETGRLWHVLTMEAHAIGTISPPPVIGEHVTLCALSVNLLLSVVTNEIMCLGLVLRFGVPFSLLV